MSEAAHNGQPAVVAEDVGVRFHIRFHRSQVTLRETLVGLTFARKRRAEAMAKSEFWALSGINLTASPGEVVGLLGHNGAGKSTLLKTLAGIWEPDRGKVTVRGRVACLLSFGAGFRPNLSGRENVYVNGSLLGMSRRDIDDRIEDIIEFSELGDFIDAPVQTYSAGMRGRLGFSIAIYVQPDVLLLDEVLTVGDAAFRAKSGSMLERFQSDQRTVIIASHNLELLRTRCTKILWIDKGRMRDLGDPDEIVKAYRLEYGTAKASSAT